MSKRGLNDVPHEERDFNPACLKGNPSNQVGFLGVEGPQRGIAIVFAAAFIAIGIGYMFS